MRRLEWSEDYSLDVGPIDEHHKALVVLANAIQAAVENGRGDEIVEETVDHLIDYSAHHFTAEERYFASVGYPDLEAHRREHETLAQELVALKEDLDRGFAHVTRDIADWVWRRLIPHFLEWDKAAADWARTTSWRDFRSDHAA